ncbi:MAG: hypothetical protein ABI574_11725 [Burkholderiales bacterium]
MQSMQQAGDDKCPFEFNFNAATFKVGDTVSYRVESLGEFPFMGTLAEVGDDYVVITQQEPDGKTREVRGSRESRPLVPASQALD